VEIFGVGTDIIEVGRINAAIEKSPSFKKRVYTALEVNYCENKKKGKYPSYAARFAAKEAVAKSLLEGVGKNISLSEIELTNTENGAPYIVLYGNTLQYSKSLGIREIKVSVSATENFAVAYAISLK
jgi:holo-[acyl-carrier protein] synthase